MIGPGATGTLFAAQLARAGCQVTLIDHKRSRAEELCARGLTVIDETSEADPMWSVTMTAALPEDLARGGEREQEPLVLLCVKVMSTESALEPLVRRDLLPPGAVVCVLQNGYERGVAVEELLAGWLAEPPTVVQGVTSEGVHHRRPGQVVYSGQGRTVLGAVTPLPTVGAPSPLPPSPRSRPAAERVAQALASAGLEAEVVEDVRPAAWKKLQVNAAINALTGLLDVKNGELLRSPAAHSLASEAAAEVGQLAAKKGITGDWRAQANVARWEAVAAATARNISSTLMDLRQRRLTEGNAINGAVAEAAGAPNAPVNALLAKLLQARAELR